MKAKPIKKKYRTNTQRVREKLRGREKNQFWILLLTRYNLSISFALAKFNDWRKKIFIIYCKTKYL